MPFLQSCHPQLRFAVSSQIGRQCMLKLCPLPCSRWRRSLVRSLQDCQGKAMVQVSKREHLLSSLVRANGSNAP